jgi:hypothetical protein
MARMTWRTSDELLERVRRQAREQGRSLNDWVTAVLSAATDPTHADGEVQRVRERLSAAGLLDPSDTGEQRRPGDVELARARAAAGRGAALSTLVGEARR